MIFDPHFTKRTLTVLRNILVFLILFFAIACGSDKKPQSTITITIFHAGSLSYPLREIISGFNKEHPDIKVLTESSGSLAGARKIIDLNRICDVYATADYKIIEELLYPDHADWYVAFARNEMSVVFMEKSRYAGEINTGNWPDILTKPDVRFGRSDPDADPCGYRTLLMWQLAEIQFQRPGFYEQMLTKDTRFVRPKEVDLLALLETGVVDFIFLYRSVAEQHGLKYLILPDSINLGNPDLASHYKNASVEVRGKAPGEKIIIVGEPMVYAVTIPTKAPNPEPAGIFLQFLLDPDKGLKIMNKNGQPGIFPLRVSNEQKVPDYLSVLFDGHKIR